MKSLIALISLLSLASAPAHAFISSQEEVTLLAALNEQNSPQVQFENIRCSVRNRLCLVKMELSNSRKVGCMIERLNDASDLYKEAVVNGKNQLVLSDYSAEALRQCLRLAQ